MASPSALSAAERDALIARVFATPAGRELLDATFALVLHRDSVEQAIARQRLRWAGRALFILLPSKDQPPCA